MVFWNVSFSFFFIHIVFPNEKKKNRANSYEFQNHKFVSLFEIFSPSYRLLYLIKACIGMALGKIPVGNNKFISHLCVYTRLFFIRVCVQISFLFFSYHSRQLFFHTFFFCVKEYQLSYRSFIFRVFLIICILISISSSIKYYKVKLDIILYIFLQVMRCLFYGLRLS